MFNDIHPVDGVAIHCIVLTALDFLDTFCRLLLFENEKGWSRVDGYVSVTKACFFSLDL